MEDIFLETDRIVLKELEPEDLHLFADLDSDPVVMTYLNGGRPSTPEEIRAGFDRSFALKEKHQKRFGLWIAFLRDSNEFIGWFLFRPDKKLPDDVKNIELGYRLKKKFWGKGYATEVSRALVDLGFEKYRLDSVFAVALVGNIGSQAVMKKVGMDRVREYVESDFSGESKLAVRYELKREDWEK